MLVVDGGVIAGVEKKVTRLVSSIYGEDGSTPSAVAQTYQTRMTEYLRAEKGLTWDAHELAMALMQNMLMLRESVALATGTGDLRPRVRSLDTKGWQSLIDLHHDLNAMFVEMASEQG
jgi:hypothetical protein